MAVDPIPAVQLKNLLGDGYIVWDKSAKIRFLKPAKEHLYADFEFTHSELSFIRSEVQKLGKLEIVKSTDLCCEGGKDVFCKIDETIYVASHQYFQKRGARREAERTIDCVNT